MTATSLRPAVGANYYNSLTSGGFFSVMLGVCVDMSAFSWMKSCHSAGTLSSWKIASTGHSTRQASQSMKEGSGYAPER